MEYASGGSLASLIEKSNGLPEREVRRYAKHLLLGLLHIHDSGYVHCDIKPDNVLLVPSRNSGTYVAKIADFGLSKRRKSDPNLRGTPMYMSPEVIVDGFQEAPSDIWALGCVVLEMLTGNPPWGSDPNWTSEELLIKIAEYWVLPNIPRGISNDARSFLKACFVRKPRFRFTAEMLLQHPFVSGCEDEDDHDDVEAEEEEEKLCFFF
ncbi:mitogen-activated protein kinase kinase kinase 2-like [Tripterygium wilfordii]|uniref:Mitogen-activated protein kinase kinase kinase 2-like n=1 Tax=Tripterygium wilfordii TaxID=458696 RepID=A0A7J7D623_TRIWF|nr:mitogen-activated protein kinase kinase kinase 3-like [Tripterygium wilfordii]KAF5741810.1 mitogen-activated protein kinase kinase kinase 2-like [Tripterygium wilfordii]